MKRNSWFNRAIRTCVLVAALCGPGAAFGADTAAKTRVGIVLPLTGVLSEYGNAIRNAFAIAQDQHPELFANVELVTEDSSSDTKLALSAFEKLVTVDNVDAVYVWGTTPTEALAPAAASRKVPLLAMSISPTVAKDRPTVVRTVGPSQELIKPLTQYIEKSGFKRITLLKTEWSYTEELARALRAGLPETVAIEEITFPKGDMEFRSALARIMAAKPDAVGVFLGNGQISSFFKQREQLGGRFPVFGDDFFSSEKEIADSGPGIDGVVFAHVATCDAFTKLYQARYHNDTHIAYATNTYDMAVLLATAAREHGRASLLKQLTLPKTYDGICGKLTFHASAEFGNYFDYPTALYKVENGKASRGSW